MNLMFWKKRKKKPLLAKKVRFSYEQGKDVLKNITLNIPQGQIVTIVGKSGSGKTTFLKLVTGVIARQFKGEIKVLGKKMLFAKHLGYVPQEAALLSELSIKNNIKLFGALSGLGKKKAMLAARKMLQELQLNVSLRATPAQLSGGQRSRLNIIVSLLHGPTIAILDEPFVGLDYHNRSLLWHFFEALRRKKKTLILTTHLMTEAEKHADRIVLIKEGKMLLHGPPNRIKEKLRTNYILELNFQTLNKAAVQSIKDYCKGKTIKVLDTFYRNIIFSLEKSEQKAWLEHFLDKLNLSYEEVEFRQPTLDEVFLGAGD